MFRGVGEGERSKRAKPCQNAKVEVREGEHEGEALFSWQSMQGRRSSKRRMDGEGRDCCFRERYVGGEGGASYGCMVIRDLMSGHFAGQSGMMKEGRLGKAKEEGYPRVA